MTSLFIPLGLACIMFTVGLGLAVADFRAVAARPGTVALGVLAQMLALPLLALAIALAFALPPVPALGLVLVACVPGGVTSNFITVLARGDAALSVVLTVVTTLLGVLTVPLVLAAAMAMLDPAGLALPDRLPLGDTSRAVLLVTALPMLLGMAVRCLAPGATERGLPVARRIATALFAVIVVLAFLRDWDVVESGWRVVGPAVLAFNALAVLGGLALARAAALGDRAAVTLGIECGLQNVALALFLGGSVLGAPGLMVPAVIYVLAMNASALVLVAHGRRLADASRGSAGRGGQAPLG